MMTYRRLGRTNLKISVVGFGTCQLRMVPEQRAIDAMARSFSLGVNIVHTAPDYLGADDLVAEAVKASGREIFVCSQGYGNRETFEHIFETTRAKFGKKGLEMFGIACVEDREMNGENVWGVNGMVEFLQAKKREGHLLGTFCTTHGTPQYIRKLVESNVFDTILMAYNPLGYHLLSYKPDPPAQRESLTGNRELFPLFASHDVGLMLMKPLAGGLLCNGKAFKPYYGFAAKLAARDVLRSLLIRHPELACVVPGTNSEEEAEENALAGHAPLAEEPGTHHAVDAAVSEMRRRLCSRCGECDSTCHNHLPVSWMFRAAYIEDSRSMPFETLDRLRYFKLHPWREAAKCSTCTQVTCHCPNGINIRTALMTIHEQMRGLCASESSPAPSDSVDPPVAYSARLVGGEWGGELIAGRHYEFRLAVDNTGMHGWHLAPGQPAVSLEAVWIPSNPPLWRRVFATKTAVFANHVYVRMRGDIPAGQRGYFVFEMAAPRRKGFYQLEFRLRFLMGRHLLQRVFLGRFNLLINKRNINGHVPTQPK